MTKPMTFFTVVLLIVKLRFSHSYNNKLAAGIAHMKECCCQFICHVSFKTEEHSETFKTSLEFLKQKIDADT